MDGNIEITKSNSYFYVDSLSNDMVVYTGTSNQHMLFGTQSNNTSHINVWFSNITFNRLANFSCNVTIGSNPTTGLSNYVTLQTNNDFALIGNNVDWPLDHGGPALYMRYSLVGACNSSFIQSINRNAGTSNMLDMQIQASNLYIATGGLTPTVNVTFRPNGFVGIGTSNPSELLHLIGNTRTTGLIAMNSNQPIVFGSNMVVGNAARIGFNLTGNSNYLDIFGGATSTSTGRQIYFWIDSNQSAGATGMATFGGGTVFLNTGSLGIGTSNPLSRFHINSNADCYSLYTNNVNSNGIKMGLEDGVGGAQIWNSSNGGYIKLGTSNTERMKIAVNGFIGIGVSNPINLLHVHNVTSTTSNVIQMTNVGIGSNVGNGFQLGQDQTGNIYLWNQENAMMQFATTNIERMRITSTGALGIGNIAPATLVHMTSNTSNYITHTNTVNTLGVMFGIEENATGGNAVIWQRSNAHIKFGTNNIERIRMTSNGYLGIGTQNPSSKLTITGYDGSSDNTQYGLLQLIQNATGAIAGFHSNLASISIIRLGNQVAGMGYSKGQSIFGFGLGTNSNTDFYPSNLSMNLSTGCIGINNLNPTSAIHALSNTFSFQFPGNQAGTSLSLYNSAGATSAILFGQGNSANNCGVIRFGYTATGNNSNYLGFGCYSTDDTLTVTAAANVGIGTTSPVYKLDVNGSVNINKGTNLNNKLLVLWEGAGGSTDSLTTACNFYGFGINTNTLRYQVPFDRRHTFYQGTSNIMVIGGNLTTNIGIGTLVPTFITDIWQQNANTKMLRLLGDCYKNISTYDPSHDDFSQFSISSCNNVTAGAYKVIMRVGVTTSNNYGFIQMANPFIGKPQLCLQPQAGNVGINTSNPAYSLDTAGGIRASNEIISTGASSANHFRAIYGNYGVIFRNDGGSFYLLSTNSGDQYGGWSGNRPFTYTIGTGTVTIATGAITAFNNGFVGLNTVSPQEQLHVTGNIKTSGTIISVSGHLVAPTVQVFNSSAATFIFRSITGSNINTFTELFQISGCNLIVRGTICGPDGTAGNGWAMNLIDNVQAYKAIIVGSNNSLNNASEMGFTNVGNGNAANRMNLGLWGNPYIMNILASGNVGIGTTSPTQKLHVIGNILSSGTVTGTSFIGSGASMTTLNAANITTGTLAVARGGTGVTTSTGTGNVVLSASPTLTGTTTMDNISFNGARTISNTVGAITISSEYDIIYTADNNNNNGGGCYHRWNSGPTQTMYLTNGGNLVIIGAFTGNGSGITTLNAANISTGTLPVARGGTGVTTSTGTGNVVLSASPTFTGSPAINGELLIGGATYNGSYPLHVKGGISSSFATSNAAIVLQEGIGLFTGMTVGGSGDFSSKSLLIYSGGAFGSAGGIIQVKDVLNVRGTPLPLLLNPDGGTVAIRSGTVSLSSLQAAAAKAFYVYGHQTIQVNSSTIGLSINYPGISQYLYAISAQGGMYFHRNDSDVVRYDGLFAFSSPMQAPSYSPYSDDRLKTDETFIENATATINKLRPQIYNKHAVIDFATNESDIITKESGLIAQEIFYDAPELRHIVNIPKDANSNVIYNSKITSSTDPSIDPDYKDWGTYPASVNYTGLIPYLIKSIQEKDIEINDLLLRVSALEKKLI